jgi:hypothetical protein
MKLKALHQQFMGRQASGRGYVHAECKADVVCDGAAELHDAGILDVVSM